MAESEIKFNFPSAMQEIIVADLTKRFEEYVEEIASSIEEDKFYIKLPAKGTFFLSGEFLNLNKETGQLEINSKIETDGYKTKFTQEEIDAMQKDLPEFNLNMMKMPVEEVEEWLNL